MTSGPTAARRDSALRSAKLSQAPMAIRRPALLLLLLAVLCAVPAMASTYRTLEAEATLAADGEVQLEIPVAELTVEGTDGDRVELELEIDCRSDACRRKAERIRIDQRGDGDRAHFEIDGYPSNMGSKPDLTLRVRMPRDRHLSLELGVGEVEISGIDGNLEIEVGVGDVDLDLDESAVRSVDLAVGVGDAELDLPSRYSSNESGFLFLGQERSWDDGPGRANVDLEVGVGDATVTVR